MTPRFRPALRQLDPRLAPAVFGTPWPSSDLTLSFVPDGTDVNGRPSSLGATLAGVPAPLRQREILRAAQTWVTAAGVNVGLVADGGLPVGAAGTIQGDPRFGDVRVAAIPVAADAVALGLPFDVTAGTRAGDVWLNGNEPFTAGGGADTFDLYSVALHELGHVFGLPGSADPASAMYQQAVAVRTGLAPADVAGVVALYGQRAPDAFEGLAGNETLAAAAPLPSDDNISTATADLTTASDVDVYSFRAGNPRGAGLTVSVRVAGRSLVVPRLEVFDAAGAVVAAGVGGGPGAGDVSLYMPAAVEGATYLARVTAADAAFAVGGYTLEARPGAPVPVPPAKGLPNPDVGDNDTLARATTLDQKFLTSTARADYAVRGALNTGADVDFFRLRSPNTSAESGTAIGPLTVTLLADAAGTDPVAEVFDRRGQPVAVTPVTHDAGTFVVQVPAAAENRDYYVAVRHGRAGSAAGGYTLGADFGVSPGAGLVTLPRVAAGTLTADVPEVAAALHVEPSQVLHLVLSVEPAAASATVRLAMVDAAGRTVDFRKAAPGDFASLNVELAAGDYQLVLTETAPGGGPLPAVGFVVAGLSVSDPVGPQAVPGTDPIQPAPPPPPPPLFTVGPVTPRTPVTPVQPVPPSVLPPPPPPSGQLPPAARPLPRTFAAGGAGGRVQTFNPDGTPLGSPTSGLAGGVRVAVADVTGDGVADLVVGSGPGGPSLVRVLDGATQRELFRVQPFEASFTGGVFVAAGDLTGDGKAELVISPDEGGGPRVRVFNADGFAQLADFFGIDDPNFRGGARAAVGDLSGDGVGDLIVAAGFGGGPRVAAFDGRTVAAAPARLFADFFAFEPALRNGVYVAAGDVDADGTADLVTGAGPGGGPRVSVFGGRDLLADRHVRLADFFAGDPEGRGGVPVAVKDLDGDGRADLVTGAGPGGPARVSGFTGQAAQLFAVDVFPGDLGGVYVG